MKHLYICVRVLLLFVLLSVCNSSHGAVSINSSFLDSTLCPSDSFNVPYTVSSPYAAGNTFQVLLSDTGGHFGSSIVAGSLVNNVSGTIRCVIPAGILSSHHYRIKIISSVSGDSSADNGRNITITNIAPLFISNNGPICAGDSLALQAFTFTPGVSYHWTGPNGFASNIPNPYVLNAQQTLSGTFVVIASLNNCSVSTNISVTVKQTPVPVAASNSPVCVGDTLQLKELSTIPGQVYSWIGPGGMSSTAKNPPILNAQSINTGTYIVVVSLNGCTASDTINVAVNPVPAKPIATSTTALCAGDTLRLTANSATPGVTYQWSAGGLLFNIQNLVLPNAQPTQSGLYTVRAVLGNCSSIDSEVVIIRTNPIVSSGLTDSVCEGDTLVLQASSNVNGMYHWTNNSGYTDSGKGIVTRPLATASFAGIYFVQLTDSNGCRSNKDSLFAIVKPLPVAAEISGSGPVCEGHPLMLNASSSSAGVVYSWEGPAGITSNTSKISIASATSGMSGKYSCTMVLDGCSLILDTTVLVKASISPDVTISVDPGIEVSRMTPMTFTAHAINAGLNPRYQWKLNGTDIAGATDSVYTCRMGMGLGDKDKIFVVVTSNEDCPLSDSVLSFAFTLKVKSGDSDPFGVDLFPNPNEGHLSVSGFLPSTEKAEARVINAIGQLIYKATLLPTGNLLYADIDLGHISSGIYTFQVKSGDQIFNKRFTIK